MTNSTDRHGDRTPAYELRDISLRSLVGMPSEGVGVRCKRSEQPDPARQLRTPPGCRSPGQGWVLRTAHASWVGSGAGTEPRSITPPLRIAASTRTCRGDVRSHGLVLQKQKQGE